MLLRFFLALAFFLASKAGLPCPHIILIHHEHIHAKHWLPKRSTIRTSKALLPEVVTMMVLTTLTAFAAMMAILAIVVYVPFAAFGKEEVAECSNKNRKQAWVAATTATTAGATTATTTWRKKQNHHYIIMSIIISTIHIELQVKRFSSSSLCGVVFLFMIWSKACKEKPEPQKRSLQR